MFITVGIVGEIMLFFVSPDVGLNNIGSSTVIWRASDKIYLTKEFLWYSLVTTFKRVESFAVVIAFLLSTTPSELAAGLNRIGMPYRVCIIVSLAYRTIPDVARHFFEIRNSLQMRGIELSKKAGLWARIKQTTLLLVPLIFSSFGKVENIANAMDLRSFGKNKRRTWFAEHEPTKLDKILRTGAIVLGVLMIVYIIWSKAIDPYPARIWCPFVKREDIVNVNIVDTMFFMKWFKK
jgi:energy-coupling factor transport system permease protein